MQGPLQRSIFSTELETGHNDLLYLRDPRVMTRYPNLRFWFWLPSNVVSPNARENNTLDPAKKKLVRVAEATMRTFRTYSTTAIASENIIRVLLSFFMYLEDGKYL